MSKKTTAKTESTETRISKQAAKETKTATKPATKPEAKKEKPAPKASIKQAIWAYLEKVGVDNAKHEDMEKIALKVKPESAYKKTHTAWYIGKFKQAAK